MFNVGDRVICVDAEWLPGSAQIRLGLNMPLVKGQEYVIEAVENAPNHQWLLRPGALAVFVGVPNMTPFGDIGWSPARFRKIQHKRTREELYSLIGIDGMVDQRESVTAFHKFPCESASLRAPARQPVREMAVGVTVGSPRRVSRGTDGARLAVTLTRKGTHSLREWAGRPAAAAQRIGTAEGSGDGSSVRSDWLAWGGGVMAKRWTPEEEIAALAFIRGASCIAPAERSVGVIRQKFPDDIAFLVVDGFDRLPRDVRHTLSMPFLRMAASRPISLDDRNGAQKAIDDFRAEALKHAILRGYSCPDGDEWAASVRAELFRHQSCEVTA